jgi:hypothetical protein
MGNNLKRLIATFLVVGIMTTSSLALAHAKDPVMESEGVRIGRMVQMVGFIAMVGGYFAEQSYKDSFAAQIAYTGAMVIMTGAIAEVASCNTLCKPFIADLFVLWKAVKS